jgi:hypothetical protein
VEAKDAVYRIVSALSPAVEIDALEEILALLRSLLTFSEMEHRKTAADSTRPLMTLQLSWFRSGKKS